MALSLLAFCRVLQGEFVLATNKGIFAVQCLARASIDIFVVMTASQCAVCCLARAGTRGTCVKMQLVGLHIEILVGNQSPFPHGLGSIHESGLEQGGGSWTSMVGGRSLYGASLLDALSWSHKHEWHSILCNLPNKLVAISIPMPMLFLRVFSLKDFLVFSAPPRAKDTIPSFHATTIPPCWGAF
jgi:hypothetical protein